MEQRSPFEIDGISIVPTLLGEGEQTEHEGMYWEYARSGGLTRAARMGRWKAVQATPNGAVELYDLEVDISETENVAGENPEVVARLVTFMDGAHVPIREYPQRIERPTIDDYVR